MTDNLHIKNLNKILKSRSIMINQTTRLRHSSKIIFNTDRVTTALDHPRNLGTVPGPPKNSSRDRPKKGPTTILGSCGDRPAPSPVDDMKYILPTHYMFMESCRILKR